jgi:hypothetical protein
MPTYEMTAPNGLTYRIDGPAGATDAQVKAKILAQHPEAARAAPKPKAKSRQRGTGIGVLDTTLDVINEALIGIPEGAYNAAAMITDPIAGLIFGKETVKKAQKQRKEAVGAVARTFVTKPRPIAREVGRAVLPAAGVTRAASLAAPVLQKAPVVGNALARIATATASGGIGSGRTAAQTAALTKGQRVAQLGERMVGGAISGGATAGLMGQDIGEGALFGAGLPVVANVLKRVGGKVVDLTRLPKLKAAEIIRESLGENLDEARAAFAQLSPDDQRLARQVLIEADIEPDTFMGLGADVERLRPEQTRRVLEGQAAAREASLADISGGATATQRRGAAETGRRAVSEATGPAREAALERANVAGRAVPAAERLASAALARADEMTASGFVPRMRGLEERSRGQIDAVFQNPEFFTQGGPVNRIGEIAEGAGQRADDAISEQLRLRGVAQDMEDVVADLAAEGMQPLQVAPIVSEIRRMANAPATRISTLQRRALTKAANQLEAAQDANGVIDARDLYQFRKSELGDIINVLMSARNQPPSGVKEAAAGKMADVRKIIDDAIESAGGTGFKDYLVRTRQGFEAVNRQELAAEGARLAKKSPDEFIELMGGDRDKIVEEIMGKGTKQYDIGGMALMDPRRYNTMMNAARELKTLNRMRELGQSGATVANELIGRERPFLARSLTRMGLAPFPPARIATEGGEMALAALMRPRVRERLANAFVSGQDMREAIEQYPTAFNISEQISRRPYSKMAPQGLRNVMAQGLVRPITADFPEIDPETGEILLEVGFNEDGSTYPIYGRPPAR